MRSKVRTFKAFCSLNVVFLSSLLFSNWPSLRVISSTCEDTLSDDKTSRIVHPSVVFRRSA